MPVNMAYKSIQIFYLKALAVYGFRSWADFEAKAKKRNWRMATYAARKREIETLATALHGAYLDGATDAVHEIKRTKEL